MTITPIQQQVIQLLPWYLAATLYQRSSHPDQDAIQALDALVSTDVEYLQVRKAEREKLSTMNTAKNSVNSSVDMWVGEIVAMQDDREDKQAGIESSERELEKIRAEMNEREAVVAKTIDSSIGDKAAELAAIQAELERLEQGKKDQIAEACADLTLDLKELTVKLEQQAADLEDRETELLAKDQMIKGFGAQGNAGNFVYESFEFLHPFRPNLFFHIFS